MYSTRIVSNSIKIAQPLTKNNRRSRGDVMEGDERKSENWG